MKIIKLSKFKIGLIVILLVGFFIILNLFNFSKDVKNFFYLASAPIQKIFWEAGDGLSDFFKIISNTIELKETNEGLKLKVQKLSAEATKLRDLKKENKALREALDLDIQKEFKITFAKIISKDITQDLILINRGLKDGILKDMPVVSSQKIFLGKISQVYDNFSKVILISNKESVFSVNIQNEEVYDIIEAVAKGVGGFQVKVDRILPEIKIKEGDWVATSTLGGFLPSGILVGYINNIERLGPELFQRAEIHLAVDIRELRNVFIITEF